MWTHTHTHFFLWFIACNQILILAYKSIFRLPGFIFTITSHLRLLSNHTMVAISLVMTVLSILILGTQDVRGYYPAPTCSGPPWVCLRNRSPVIGRPLPVQFGARGSNRAPYHFLKFSKKILFLNFLIFDPHNIYVSLHHENSLLQTRFGKYLWPCH